MDFFTAQDQARGQTKRLVLLFGLAVAGIIAAIYVAFLVLAATQGMQAHSPQLLALVAGGTVLVVGIASTVRTAKLRSGGRVVAEMLGGVRVEPSTQDAAERRLVNVVEEMAIASGVAVPGIYVLPEDGINAFAAGYTVDDAVVAVTKGALDQLSRDELQGVVAHEFSHILNGDMRLNIRLMGLLFGILVIAIIGRIMLRSGGGRSRGKNKGGGLVLFALALVVIGYIGVFFGRMIQAAVSRQREYLADAAAVQFTRDPDGIGGALKKIGGWREGSQLRDAHAAEAGHMFFASGLKQAMFSALATHPPLDDRIRRIDPSFRGAGAAASKSAPVRAGAAGLHGGASAAQDVVASVGALRPQDLAAATQLLENMPQPLREAAHHTGDAQALLMALLTEGAATAEQRARIERLGGAGMLARMDALQPHVAALDDAAYQPMLELLIPALRELEPARRRALDDAAHDVAMADGHATMREHAVLHLLQRQLTPSGSAASHGRVRGGSAQQLKDHIEVLLSAVAWAGTEARDQATSAFAAGAASLQGTVAPLALRDRAAVDPLTEPALQALRSARPAVKRAFLEAAALTAAEDGDIHPREMQLIRAVAEAIETPLPLAGVVAHPAPAR